MIIIVATIAVAVAFNVSMSNQKQDAASLLALANVEALAQSEGGFDWNSPVSWIGQWWNTSPANLTGLQFIGSEPYAKEVKTGTFSITTTPGYFSPNYSGDGNWGFSYTPSLESRTDDYKTIQYCRDSYISVYKCTPDSDC